MKIAYWAGPNQSWESMLSGCQFAESVGYDGVWVADHFMPNIELPADGEPAPDSELEPTLEAWTAQAALAALVPRVRIGAMVTGNTYRHPAVLANMALTADHISGGRMVLGLGAGWQVNEHHRYGITLDSPKVLSDRLEEACQVIRGLFDNTRTTFAGEHYQLDEAPCEPKAVQDRLPLLVAGRGPKRTLRTVAQYADEWNAWGRPDDMAELMPALTDWCEQFGRNVDDIHISACAALQRCDDTDTSAAMREGFGMHGGLVGTADELKAQVEAYAEAGVDELVIPDFFLGDDRNDVIAWFRDLVD